MTSRPIIFDAESVRAILAGRKTQTRRAVKPQPNEDWYPEVGFYHPVKVARDGEEYPGDEVFGAADEEDGRVCPYGAPGDELWVRETIRLKERWNDGRWADAAMSVYCADDVPTVADAWPWKTETLSSIHCPIGLSRITLRVTDVRVERVQEITEADAIAEGVDYMPSTPASMTHRGAFSKRWENINAKRGFSWGSNPWVWVVTFERIDL